MPSPTRLASTEARVGALAYAFNNADATQIEAAAANLANGCAAFWHRSGGNSAPAAFMSYLNRTQDVQRAWEAYQRDFNRPSRMRDEAMLDQLLPLNELAVHSLLDAYAATGWHRSMRELVARTDKAEDVILPLDKDRIEADARATYSGASRVAPPADAVRQMEGVAS
jgi:hypothetical protein